MCLKNCHIRRLNMTTELRKYLTCQILEDKLLTNYYFEKQPEFEWAIPGNRIRKKEKYARKIKKSSPTQIPLPQMRSL